MEFDAGGDMTAWVGIAYAVISALLGWIWKLQSKINVIELDLAKNYHNSDELEKAIDKAVEPLTKALDRIENMLERAFPIPSRAPAHRG